jgi:DNA-directed RNA polymerase specialized sigma24 family protein
MWCRTLSWFCGAGRTPTIPRGGACAFLLGIARKLVLKRARDERAYDPLKDETSVCQPIDVEGLARAEIVARAVQALPQFQREASVLAEYEGLTLDEIARATGAELAAVKSRLHTS